MDPLVNVPLDLHDLLFQHLLGKDFSESTKVTPLWNESLSKSLVMMKSVKFEIKSSMIRNEKHVEEMEKGIMNTIRRYRNISVKLRCDLMKYVFQQTLLRYFSTLGPTLIKLEIFLLNEWSLGTERSFDRVDLSRLKVLKLNHVTEELTNYLLGRCTSLVRLEIEFILRKGALFNSQPTLPSLGTFFTRNRSLEILEMKGTEYYHAFFNEDISETVQFELRTLNINIGLSCESLQRNFLKFLTKHSRCMENLTISKCGRNVIEHIFGKMSALKSLNIGGDLEFRDFTLNINENIVELKIPNIFIAEKFREIVQNAPNLTKLMTKELNSAKVEIIRSCLPELGTLLFHSCDSLNDEPVWVSLWPHAAVRNIPDEAFGMLYEVERNGQLI